MFSDAVKVIRNSKIQGKDITVASRYFDTKNLKDEELKEKLRDIPPLHLWSKFSNRFPNSNFCSGIFMFYAYVISDIFQSDR